MNDQRSERPPRPTYTPERLAEFLGQKFPPSKEQSRIASAPPQGNYLVVAGAGAGKTETMAARVVWLVANGYARPDEILGLTFTRKAASSLGDRIRKRLEALVNSPYMDELRAVDPSDPRIDMLSNLSLAVSTYDSYAGAIVREYGLLLPVEPNSRIITAAERWLLAHDLVLDWPQPITIAKKLSTTIDNLLKLSDEMDNHLVAPTRVADATQSAIDFYDALSPDLDNSEKSSAQADIHADKFLETQHGRLELLPLVEAFREKLRERNLMTFGEQMSRAAELAERHRLIGEEQRKRFKVVLLDEYQDTGYAQRVLLRSLFGEGQGEGTTVTAVGDPMQSIYQFRGATASNLEKFRQDFPDSDGTPATKLEMSLSFRNPAEVLTLANRVTGWMIDNGVTIANDPSESPVVKLRAAESNKPGDITAAFFETEEQEIAYIADALEKRWRSFEAGEMSAQEFSAAVLVRKNSQALPVFNALRERGVPAEITTGTGLLSIAEVATVVATLRVLVTPHDEQALLQLLTSYRWNIGAADIAALARRAQQLAREPRESGPSGEQANHEQLGSLSDDQAAARAFGLQGYDDKLTEQVLDLIPDNTAITVSLVDALADLGDSVATGMSDEGYRRLSELFRILNNLARFSMKKALPDLVADIEKATGVRSEVLTNWHGNHDLSIGTSHLDKFADIVRGFAEQPTASPRSLITYLDAAIVQEGGLEPGEVAKRNNVVQILTVHKAKGLEWDIVAVPYASRSEYGDIVKPSINGGAPAWTREVAQVPAHLRGDVDFVEAVAEPDSVANLPDNTGMPVFRPSESAATPTEHEKAAEAYEEEVKAYLAEEYGRVFYVAITRTERVLIVTGSALKMGAVNANDPSIYLQLIRDELLQQAGMQLPEPLSNPPAQLPPQIVEWSFEGTSAAASGYKKKAQLAEQYQEQATEARLSGDTLAMRKASARYDIQTRMFPDVDLNEDRQHTKKERQAAPAAEKQRLTWPRPAYRTVPEMLLRELDFAVTSHDSNNDSAPQYSTVSDPGTIAHTWDIETDLIIAEIEANSAATIDVPLPSRLTATQAVLMKDDAEEFARRLRRPIPMQPQPYAKRGTAFHNWVESHFGIAGLLDEDQLPGAADADYNDPELERLKARFLDSEWALQTPEAVEASYTVSLAGYVFEGKIDAVFHQGDDPATGWTIVDWKTGAKPEPKAMNAAKMQLAVYRAAWAKILGKKYGVHVEETDIRAAFHYVRTNETFEPELPTAQEFETYLRLDSEQ